MTQRSVLYLKGKFETGDIPVQSDYQDVFDSFLSLESSVAQTINGPLNAPTLQISGKLFRSTNSVVSAAGKVQASAVRLTSDVSYVFTTNDAERAVVLASVESGRAQVVINTATTALFVFPSSGCNFVGSASDGAIILAANGCLIAHHIGVSAYGVVRTQGV